MHSTQGFNILSENESYCRTIYELLSAVNEGRYRNGPFIMSCRIPAYNDIPKSLCPIVYQGDSLTRHMKMATWMIMKNDFVLGGFPRQNMSGANATN
jgi:hypothetical protein